MAGLHLGARGWLGAAGLGLVLGGALLAPWVAPYDPRLAVGRPFEAPSAAHWLGTNDIGQDILSELVWGGRVSLAIGGLAGVLGSGLGVGAGVLGGYLRGRTDALIVRAADLVLMVPVLPLMIVLAAFIGPGLGSLAAAIALLGWARPARIVRAVVLGLGAADFVAAARALGASHRRIVVRHVAPAVASVAVAELVHLVSRAILLEASLAFLGLGDPLRKSWGSMLFYAQARGAFLSGAWLWWVLPPGLLTAATVLGVTLLGYELERVVNPRLRAVQDGVAST